jgi:hypothetical protein
MASEDCAGPDVNSNSTKVEEMAMHEITRVSSAVSAVSLFTIRI